MSGPVLCRQHTISAPFERGPCEAGAERQSRGQEASALTGTFLPPETPLLLSEPRFPSQAQATLQLSNWFVNRREEPGGVLHQRWLPLTALRPWGPGGAEGRLLDARGPGGTGLLSFLGSRQQSWFGPTAKMGTRSPEGQGPRDHIAVRPRLPGAPRLPNGAEPP